jgi:hypothetical protein
MTSEGPLLDRLTHRLAECPPDFLATPRVGSDDGVHVDAVVRDLVVHLGGGAPTREALAPFAPPGARSARHLSLGLIASWLLYDDWFRTSRLFGAAALRWVTTGLPPLAELVAPDLFVRDPDRREELARLCLAALGLRPAGETRAQAEDRLKSLDSVERVRVLRDTREQHARARRLREEMQKKEAAEAAAKVSREW